MKINQEIITNQPVDGFLIHRTYLISINGNPITVSGKHGSELLISKLIDGSWNDHHNGISKRIKHKIIQIIKSNDFDTINVKKEKVNKLWN